jgi:hypothetical protein
MAGCSPLGAVVPHRHGCVCFVHAAKYQVLGPKNRVDMIDEEKHGGEQVCETG